MYRFLRSIRIWWSYWQKVVIPFPSQRSSMCRLYFFFAHEIPHSNAAIFIWFWSQWTRSYWKYGSINALNAERILKDSNDHFNSLFLPISLWRKPTVAMRGIRKELYTRKITRKSVEGVSSPVRSLVERLLIFFLCRSCSYRTAQHWFKVYLVCHFINFVSKYLQNSQQNLRDLT